MEERNKLNGNTGSAARLSIQMKAASPTAPTAYIPRMVAEPHG